MATHKITLTKRAVKIIYKDQYDTQEQKKIMNEVEILRSIDHPHVVKVFEYFEDAQRIFIVMEFLEGGELFDKIRESEYFSENNAKKIIKNLLETINYLHTQNIVH